MVKVMSLMERSATSGKLASDASLAVYAIESRATLCSNDRDFARFPGLQWKDPLVWGEMELRAVNTCSL